jgi:iron(III) transport system permease protein
MRRILAETVLFLGLLAAVGWPALATAWEARPGRTLATLSGAGGIARPLELAKNTLQVVLTAEAIALPAGLALAFLLSRTDLWGRRPLLALIVLAMFIPLPLHATAWLGAFGNVGRSQAIGSRPILVGWAGAATVHALAALPWVVVLAGVGLRSVEPRLEEAALLDLPAWRVVGRITLRRSVGAIVAAALAVAVLTAGDMTVTDLVQPPVRTFAEEAYTESQLGLGQGASAAIVSLPSLLVLGLTILLATRMLLRSDPARLASAESRARTWRLGPWRVPQGVLVAVTAGNVVALPIYGLIWRAGRVGGSAARGIAPHWSVAGLARTLLAAGWEMFIPLGKSLFWAGVGATATLLLAWPLAWLSRRPGPWRWVAAVCVALPLATPGSVAGMALMLAYRDVPFVYDTYANLVLAYVLRTLPYAILVLWPSLRTLPEAHLDAAAIDGYDGWGQVRKVALPLSRGALAAAWGVAFVLAFGELSASLVVEPPTRVRLFTSQVWALLHTGVESHLAGVALVMLTVVGALGLAVAAAITRLYAPVGEGNTIGRSGVLG